MTEKGLKRIIFLYAGKIKRLQGELQGTIARKKDAEADLRTIKWDVKVSKKAAKNYPDKIDKAIETMAAKFNKKVTKKKAK